MKQKLICFLLALSLLIPVLPGGALASSGTASSPEPGADNDALFAGYVEQLFCGRIQPLSVGANSAGAQLSGDTRLAYDALVPIVTELAAGQRSSAIIRLGSSSLGAVDTEVAFTSTNVDLGALLDALTADLPYEMYWYDKTIGCSYYVSSSGSRYHFEFYFVVAAQYMGEDPYTLDTARLSSVPTAAANARAIVEAYASSTDYDKLVGYKTEICDLVSYNDTAADTDGYFSDTSSDPWQLIYVFDGDDDTNVVCEGYSKAYQYLCDMTCFQGEVSCYSVNGYMASGGSYGGHMWNIVRIGENSYLADITNSDLDTVGQNGGLFLAGSDREDNENFRVTFSSGEVIYLKGYLFTAGGSTVGFYYDYDLLWDEDILTLAATEFDPSAGCSEGHSCGQAQFSWSDDFTSCTVSVRCPCGFSQETGAEVSSVVTPSAITITATAAFDGSVVTDVLEFRLESGSLSLPEALRDDVMVLVAAYNSHGQMIGIRHMTQRGTDLPLSLSGHTLRVYFLDGVSCSPILPPLFC